LAVLVFSGVLPGEIGTLRGGVLIALCRMRARCARPRAKTIVRTMAFDSPAPRKREREIRGRSLTEKDVEFSPAEA